jgi:hypothetical protein
LETRVRVTKPSERVFFPSESGVVRLGFDFRYYSCLLMLFPDFLQIFHIFLNMPFSKTAANFFPFCKDILEFSHIWLRFFGICHFPLFLSVSKNILTGGSIPFYRHLHLNLMRQNEGIQTFLHRL